MGASAPFHKGKRMGKFTKHNALTDDGDMYGPITITSSLVVSGAVTCDSISFSGTQTFEAGMVVNDLGAAVDFRVEGDTLPNLLLLDGSADRIFITDADTGGTAPTDPTGGYAAGTLLAIVNNSTVNDDAILALVAGATTGMCQITFGDSGDANIGMLSYDHATNLFTVTAGATTVGTLGAAAVALQAAVTINESGAALDTRIEGDTLPNLFLLDGSADRIFVTDAATGGTPPTDPTGGFAAGTLLAIVNNSAAGDDAILGLIADATSGLSEVHFGDANDANAGIVSYDHATDLYTVTAGTTAVLTVGATSVTVDEAGAGTIDFRCEGATYPNLLLVDGSADRVFLSDAATGGTPPTDPTGGYAAGTFLAVVNNSAGGDDAIVALISDATSGLSEVHFGDADDANIGIISYDNAADDFTFTAGTSAVLTVSASALAFTGATTLTGNCTVTDTVDTDTLVLGTAAMALGNADNDDVADPGCSVAIISGPTAAFTISGIAGGADGRVLIIINNVAQNLTFENENGGSAAANRITTSTGGDVATTAAGYAILVYNGTTSRWNLIASST